MGVSGQHHAPAALYPREKDPSVPIVQEAGWAPEPVWTQRLEEKILCPRRGSNPDRAVVQPVVRHYTAWANPAPSRSLLGNLIRGVVMKPTHLLLPSWQTTVRVLIVHTCVLGLDARTKAYAGAKMSWAARDSQSAIWGRILCINRGMRTLGRIKFRTGSRVWHACYSSVHELIPATNASLAAMQGSASGSNVRYYPTWKHSPLIENIKKAVKILKLPDVCSS
jgi:hypothetical protein